MKAPSRGAIPAQLSEYPPDLQGIELPDDEPSVVDGIRNQIGFPLEMMNRIIEKRNTLDALPVKLRQSQEKALDDLIAFFLANASSQGRLKGYFVQPTGAGKTILMGTIAKLLSLPTLIVVPTKELLHQTKDKFIEQIGFNEDQIGIIGDNLRQAGKPITICTYASLRSLTEAEKSGFRLVICDEAHTGLGKSTQNSLAEITGSNEDSDDGEYDQDIDTLDETEFESALMLGFTATPHLRNSSVGGYFGPLISRTSYAELIESGILKKLVLRLINKYIKPGEISNKMSERQEAELLSREHIYADLITEYCALKNEQKNLNTAAFCVNIAECIKMKSLMEENGIKAAIITSKQCDMSVKEAEAKMLAGELDVIITVDKLAVGWDFPALNCIILARATLSPARILQPIGRGMRAVQNGEAQEGDQQVCHVLEAYWQLRGSDRKNEERERKAPATIQVRTGNSIAASSSPLSTMQAFACMGEDLNALLDDSNTVKLEIFDDQALVELIKETYPTFEDWCAMHHTIKKKIKFQGLGIIALARYFGIEGNPIDNIGIHKQLGAKIYGVEYETADLEKFNKQEIIALIKEAYPTFEAWCDMHHTIRKKAKFKGMGLCMIASSLGIEGNPIYHVAIFKQLGAKIYGVEYEPLDSEKLKQAIIDEIKAAYPTFEDWCGTHNIERRRIKIKDMGTIALARYFGIEGNPVKNNEIFRQLGAKIYSVEYKTPDLEEFKQVIINEIKAAYPTFEAWCGMNRIERRTRKFKYIGTIGLARYFGIEGNPIQNIEIHKQLGAKIYGVEYEPLDSEKLKQAIIDEIKAAYPTFEDWCGMRGVERRTRKFKDMGTIALATYFGVEGNPIRNIEIHKQLGATIYGVEYKTPDLEELKQAIIDEIKEAYPTFEAWCDMHHTIRVSIKFQKMGIIAIARCFGIEGNPTHQSATFRQLGTIIYEKEIQAHLSTLFHELF